MKEISGGLDGRGLRVAVVVSRWNELVTQELLRGALDELSRQGVTEPVVVRVPGAWEIPVAVASLTRTGSYDGVVALGCIIQGETSHAGQLASDVSGELMSLQSRQSVPIGYGILTPEDEHQALQRVGLKHGHKGRDAAQAVLEMVNLLAKLKEG